jgi:hypothetical protein
MTWLKQCLIATSSLLTLMVLLVLADAMGATAQSGHPPGPDVTVVNTEANPIPVTAATPLPVIGSVNLDGTPTVQLSPGAIVEARQAGEWNVDIDRVRVPLQRAQSFVVPDGALQGSGDPLLVPAGHRLIIEQVTALAFSNAINPDQRWRFLSVETMVDGVVAVHHFPFAFDGFNASVVSQQVRLYADPGSQITLRSGRNFTSGNFDTHATISGYLIPVP